MREITREYFIAYVGREPENDDLERCNCKHAGQPGHGSCGWDRVTELPMFMVGFPERRFIYGDTPF